VYEVATSMEWLRGEIEAVGTVEGYREMSIIAVLGGVVLLLEGEEVEAAAVEVPL